MRCSARFASSKPTFRAPDRAFLPRYLTPRSRASEADTGGLDVLPNTAEDILEAARSSSVLMDDCLTNFWAVPISSSGASSSFPVTLRPCFFWSFLGCTMSGRGPRALDA